MYGYNDLKASGPSPTNNPSTNNPPTNDPPTNVYALHLSTFEAFNNQNMKAKVLLVLFTLDFGITQHITTLRNHTIPHHTTPHYTTPHHTTPHHTTPTQKCSVSEMFTKMLIQVRGMSLAKASSIVATFPTPLMSVLVVVVMMMMMLTVFFLIELQIMNLVHC